jgi:hypothetical protein
MELVRRAIPEEDRAGRTESQYHAVIWLDHHEARVIYFNIDSSSESVLSPADPPPQLHIKSGSASGTHVTDEPAFYLDVAKACDEAKAVLLVGPSTAKAEFVNYLHRHSPATFDLISAIETIERVTDHQLLAEGRRFFGMHNRIPLRS